MSKSLMKVTLPNNLLLASAEAPFHLHLMWVNCDHGIANSV